MNSLLKKMGCRDTVKEYARALLRYYNGCMVYRWRVIRDEFFIYEFLPAVGCKERFFLLSDANQKRLENKFEEFEIEARLAALYESLDDAEDDPENPETPETYNEEYHLERVAEHIRQTLDERKPHEQARGVREKDLAAIHRGFNRIFYKSELEQLDD